MNEIVMIPLDDLMHHPDNPRKDLGDLTELAESIQAQGILQNLTVVKDIVRNKYVVVIGNRRMEAAKLAGLDEVPCVISTMDAKEQMATMLSENMNRTDLTPYEQAEGFQMMMDLGFKVDEISEKTGFSKQTVKDRLKLTKLNKNNFSAAVNRGATLFDLIEITKLDSKKDQNDCLEVAGTENFRQRLNVRLKDQEFKKNRDRLEPVVREFMKECPEDEQYSSKWDKLWNENFKLTGSEDELRKHIQKIMKKDPDVPWCYEFQNYGSNSSILFRKGFPKKEAAPLAEGELSERQKAIRRGKHLRYVKGFWAQAYDLRKDWIRNFTPQNNASQPTIAKILMRYALDQCEWNGMLQKNHDWNDAYIRDVLGLPEKPVESGRKNPKHEWHTDYFTIWEQLEKKHDIPQARILLAWAVAGGVFWPDDPERGLYSYEDGCYENPSNRASDMPQLYEFLKEIGYQLSDMEKQLLDGTHECYQMEDL